MKIPINLPLWRPSLIAVVCITLAACATPQSTGEGVGAPLLEGMGTPTFQSSIRNAKARQFFDQGLLLTYAFHQGEAERSFREAARLEKDCAICYWGLALATGININRPRGMNLFFEARTAIGQAVALKATATPREQALIEALALRYGTPTPKAGRADLPEARLDVCGANVGKRGVDAQDLNYAMRLDEIQKQYPDDPDIASLRADAWMVIDAWGWWEGPQRTPTASAKKALELLEPMIERFPLHTGLNHHYTHLMEQSPTPSKGLAPAERIAQAAPNAGHLRHMPAHIHFRLGMYRAGYNANIDAIKAEASMASAATSQGFRPTWNYDIHHVHFLWYAALLRGDYQDSLDRANRLITGLTSAPNADRIQNLRNALLYTLVTAQRWQELGAVRKPPAALHLQTGVWHWAQVMAKIGLGDLSGAEAALAEFDRFIDSNKTRENIGGIPTAEFWSLHRERAQGELLLAQGKFKEATAAFTKGLQAEQVLPYAEPPWVGPMNANALGRALLIQGEPGKARAAFASDFARYPNNGIGLWGVVEAMKAENAPATEIARAQAAAEEQWLGAIPSFTSPAKRLLKPVSE